MPVLRHRRTTTMFLAIGFALVGCTPITWTRVTLNRPLQPKDVAFIRPGKTNWDDVIERLGAPNELSGTQSGMIANYYYYDSKHFSVDFGWPLGFFLPPGASEAPHQISFGNQGIGANTFQVTFGGSGIVQHEGFSHTAAASQFKGLPFQNYLR